MSAHTLSGAAIPLHAPTHQKRLGLARCAALLGAALILLPAAQTARAGGTDLTSLNGISFGGAGGAKTAHWGGSVTLKQSDAIAVGNGRCAFNVTFDVANTGDAPAGAPFGAWLVVKRIQAATINGVPQNNGKPDFPENPNAYIAARVSQLQAGAKESRLITTQPYLPAGTFTLQLRIDPDKQIAEVDESNNNLPPVTVTLPDLCGGVAPNKDDKTGGTKFDPKTDDGSGSKSTAGNGKSTSAPAVADLTGVKGVSFGGAIGGAGGKFVPWGGTVTLTDADAFLFSNGKCAFNVAYDMVNQGRAATGAAFKNTLFAGAKVVAIQSGLSLAAGQSKLIPTQPYLPSGSYEMRFYFDSENVVKESNESNNVRVIKVNSNASCGISPKADLASVRGIAFGKKTVAWGGTLKLTRADAFAVSNGRCAFNIIYDVANLGAAAASGFANRLASNGTPIGVQSQLALDAHSEKLINAQAYLIPGANLVSLKVDADNKIDESNEANNEVSVNVQVDSACK